MNILIVEDEFLIADQLKTLIKQGGYQCVGVAKDVASAKILLLKKPDFVLLDIKLSEGDSGITLGHFLNKQGIPFYYLTANNEFETMQEALQSKPVGYLSKPFNVNDILAALELVKESVQAKSQKIWIKSGGLKLQLPLIEILYAEASNVYTHLYTPQKKWTQRMTLKQFEDQITDPAFVKIHRSFIINKRHISKVSAGFVWIGELKLPVSKTYRDALEVL